MPGRLASAQFFAIRSPWLAFDELLRWAGGGWHTAAADPLFDQRFEEARSVLRRRLRDVLSRQEVRDAVLLSSHALEEKLGPWLEDPDSHRAEDLELVLTQQLVRLATEVDCDALQMAPVVGSIAAATSLRLGVDSSRHVQIDFAYLAEMAEIAARQTSLQRRFSFLTNSSLYCIHGKVRFLTWRAEGGRREYRVTTAELTPHLDAIIHSAQNGANFEELVSVIGTFDPTVSRDEAASYLGDLIQEQVLVPELPEREPAATLVSTAPVACVQVVRSGATPSLPQAVVEELLRGAELLCRLAPAEDRIRRFTESFFARYGDEVVPLVEALDEQYGIGFEGSSNPAEPLLGAFAFPPLAEPTTSFGARERLLLRKLEEAWRSGSEQISLSAEEIASIGASGALPLPSSFAVAGALFAADDEAIDRGEYLFRVDRVSGPSAVAGMARFCDANHHLLERVTHHLRAEESLEPERIFAEILHFPRSGDPNLVVRPRLRSYEIPYLGHPGVDSEHRIPIPDLRLCVVGERLRLTSARLGCEVVPRLTAPHDFVDSKSPPIFRFLCALQNHGTQTQLEWNWGALAGAVFLPRVVSGRLVLSRARWRLDKKMLQGIAESSAAERFKALCRARERLHLPRFVEAGTAADRAVFDLENLLSAECLIQKLKGQDATALVETLAAPRRYMHELIVPFLREKSATPTSARAPRVGAHRSFLPGSEWLQVNLYSTRAAADQVLREVASPAIDQALAAGNVDGWYFLRYTDPGFHIRLPLHGIPESLMSQVAADIRSLAMPLVETRRLSALKLDTYHRDIGRYGGAEGIAAAEEIFHCDSEAVLSIIQELSEAELSAARWQLALIGIDMLLSDLGLTAERKTQALKMARDDIASRLKVDASFEEQILSRYQHESPRLRELLALEVDPESALARGVSALRRRSENLKVHSAALVELERAGRLSRSVLEQAYSYIHLFANRLFPSPALGQELILYDFLHRLHSDH